VARITKKAWFGKKLLGWGYRPISLEGWVITIVFILAIITDMTYNKRTTTGYAILAVIVVIFFIIAYLTGDAPGSKAWDKLINKK
jgi:L-asparagine transporter-like permease